MTTKWIKKHAIAIALFMMAGASACSGGDESPPAAQEPTQDELEAVWQEAQPIIENELAKEDARSAARFPCTIMDKEAASTLLSANLEAPTFANEYKYESNLDTGDNFLWQAEACSWNNWGDGASLNIWVSRPEHFADGRVQCYGIYADDSMEVLFGGESKWEFLQSFAWAKLLVCRDDGLFFVEIHDGPEDETEARAIAIEIGDKVVAGL